MSYAGVNSIGLRRRGFTNEQISEIQEIYRYLYLSQLNISDAIERIEAELPATKERDEIILFVRNSKRGIIKAAQKTITTIAGELSGSLLHFKVYIKAVFQKNLFVEKT